MLCNWCIRAALTLEHSGVNMCIEITVQYIFIQADIHQNNVYLNSEAHSRLEQKGNNNTIT